MQRLLRFVFLPLVAIGMLVFPVAASADHGNADEASPNMFHVQNVGTPPEFETGPPGEARFNSDLAFWEAGAIRGRHHNIAVQGNYDGFRILDIKDPENAFQVKVVECRSNQGDLSLYQAQNRLIMIQSIDRPVTTDQCAAARDTPVAAGVHPVTGLPFVGFVGGFEGLRIWDITNPLAPSHIASVPTACGSHTHTTIDDQRNQRAIVYVSSYPIGASVSPSGFEGPGPRCIQPHAKISIVEVPAKAPETAHVLKEQPLHPDTLPFRGTLGSGGTGAVGCHDITALYENQGVTPSDNDHVAGGACLSEGQLWDISDPANPTTLTTHSHIRNEIIHTDGLFHTASFSMDGETVLFTDEFGGGGASGCKGEEDPKGNVWFYDNVPPGTEPVPLRGRYMLPRVQPPQDACTLHNGNVVPTLKADVGVSSAYEAGTSVFDFSAAQTAEPIIDPVITAADLPIPLVATEVAFYDAKLDCHTAGPPSKCVDDAWSSYWHNDFIYVSSGLDRPGKRGFDVYKILLPDGQQTPQAGDAPDPDDRQFRARKWRYQNPQTQDTFLQTGQGQ